MGLAVDHVQCTGADKGAQPNGAAQTKMHEGEVPQQSGCETEPEALDD